MTTVGWAQIALFVVVLLALVKPAGTYMFRVFEGDRQPLPAVFGRIERFAYRMCGVDPAREQRWTGYAFSLLAFSLLGLLVTYAIERLQHVLPLNPQQFGPVEPALAFNTAASFTTNTNWQSYTPESTMSYLTQMAGLAWHNFTSAAAGIGVALALSRGFTRRGGSAGGKTIGLNIRLPYEQMPNPYITPALNFEFHYFFMRKYWFAYLAKALVIFPAALGRSMSCSRS